MWLIIGQKTIKIIRYSLELKETFYIDFETFCSFDIWLYDSLTNISVLLWWFTCWNPVKQFKPKETLLQLWNLLKQVNTFQTWRNPPNLFKPSYNFQTWRNRLKPTKSLLIPAKLFLQLQTNPCSSAAHDPWLSHGIVAHGCSEHSVTCFRRIIKGSSSD